MDATLARLSRWFAAHCDGVREHHHGVRIDSTDNPGWWVKIDLASTSLASKPFTEIAEGVDAGRHSCADTWLHCYVVGNVWNGTGDPTRLDAILQHFLDWAGAS